MIRGAAARTLYRWPTVLATALAGAGCQPSTPAQAPRPLALLVSGDTAGWLVPCGCTANQSGGLPRRGSYVRQARNQEEVIVADAGGAPGGTSAYQRAKFEAILQGEAALGLAAHNIGGPEAALGADYLREVAARLSTPFVSSNVRDAKGQLLTAPYRIVEKNGKRVALAGVLSPRYARGDLRVEDPREAILRVAAEARGRFDSLVVLAYLQEDELRSFAAALPEADVVVGGPTGQSCPRARGVTWMASATNKGKFLVHLRADDQSGRLEWSGRVVEMSSEIPDDPDQTKNVARYLKELARADFAASETGLHPDLPASLPAGYRLAGNAACLACHQQDHAAWEKSQHAHAWRTLTEKGFSVDPFCQQCHTTGYGLPGGFETVGRSAKLVGVGCESCHGPSEAHVRAPAAHTSFMARDRCVSCHDPENSPQFAFAGYWERIRHGKPATKDVPARRTGD